MSHEMSEFAKSLLASGRADVDPDRQALECALLARLDEARSSGDAGGRPSPRGSLVRWLFAGVAIGTSVVAWLLAREEYVAQPTIGSPAQSVAQVAMVAETSSAPEAPAPTSTPETLVAVTPDSLPSAAPSMDRPAHLSASDLLREANQLRAQSRWADAAKKYDQVVRERADSPEAYPAMVALAKLCLDHLEDPQRALSLYDRALKIAPDGSLAEEAGWGRTRALRALGRRDDERNALRAFLSNHPSSLLAGPAAARLKSLDAL